MSGIEVPRDDLAEKVVIGCCIDQHATYLRITAKVDPDDFYHPELRRALEVCSGLSHLAGPSLDTLDRRIAAVAADARIPIDKVRGLVEDRPVQRDTSGSFTDRVIKAARARRLMTLAADMYNQLGSGQPLDLVLEQAEQTAWFIAQGGDAA